jgi:hypothetical protein
MARPALIRLAWAQRRDLISIVLLSTAVVAVIAGFASYRDAVKTSLLRQQLASAPPTSLGFVVNKPVRPETPPQQTPQFFNAVNRIAAPIQSFATPVDGLEMSQNILDPSLGVTTVAWRPGACDHLTITAGRCPTTANEALVHDATANSEHWKVGTVLKLGSDPGKLRIVGLYADHADSFWVGRAYFTPSGVRESASTQSATFDAVFVARSTFDALPPLQRFGTALVSFGVTPGDITPHRLDALRAVTAKLDRYGLAEGADTGAPIFAIVAQGTHSQNLFHNNIWIFLIQALILLAILLYAAMDDFLEIRVADLYVLRLRGMRWLTVLRHVLGDIVLALLVALPVGVVAGVGGTALLSRHSLFPGISPALTGTTILAGLIGLGATYLALGVALGKRVLSRGSAGPSWLASRLTSVSRSWILEVVAISAIAAGLIDLLARHQPANGTSSTGSYLLLPILLGVLGGLVIDRVLIRFARGLAAGGIGRGSLGLFLAVRHVGRFQRGARTTVIAVAGCAFATFAVSQFATVHANTSRTGGVSGGAPAVLDVSVGDTDLDAAVSKLNTHGTIATAVSVTSRGGPQDPATLIVRPTEFAAVADLSDTRLSDPTKTLSKLEPPVTPPVLITGKRLDLTMTQTSGPAGVPLQVIVTVVNPTQATEHQYSAGTLVPTKSVDLTIPLAACYPSCRLDRIGVAPSSSNPATERALQNGDTEIGLELEALTDIDEQGGETTVKAPLTTPAQWFGISSSVPKKGVGEFHTADGGLAVTLHGDLANNLGFGPATYADPMPAITSGSTTRAGTTPSFGGQQLRIHSIAAPAAIPQLRANAAIISEHEATNAGVGTTAATSEQVWLRNASDVARVTTALKADGITVESTHLTADEIATLRHQGPGLASTFLVAIALLVGIATLIAVVIDLLAIGQRRAIELVELLQTGTSRSSLTGYLVTEQLLLLGPGVIAGAALGAIAERLVSPRLAQYAASLTAPPPLYPPHVTLAALVALAFLVVAVPAVAMVARRSIASAAARSAP